MSKPLILHSAVDTIAEIPGHGKVLAAGATVPSDGESGYAPGCLFIQADGSSEATVWYCNATGSVTSCNFDAIDLNISEAALLTGLTSTAAEIDAAVGGAFTAADVGTLTVDTINTDAESTEHGAGAIGTGAAPATYRYNVNGTIITETKIDLQGLASVATANDVIGLAAGGAAYIGRNVVATNGIIYKAELICLETPAGGDDDVNVVANASAVLAYDGAGGTAYGVDGGNGAAGQVIEDLVQGLTANDYFYLTAGTGDTADTYTAGQYIFRTYGHAVLA